MKHIVKIVLSMLFVVSFLRAGTLDISKVGQFGGEIRDVVSIGDYTYTAQGNSLKIYSTADKDNPTLYSSYDTNESVNAIDIDGDYAYLTNGFDNLFIVSIADKANPTLIGLGQYSIYYPSDVSVDGNYAYVTDSEKLIIVDITDKATPTFVGDCRTSKPMYEAKVVIDGNYAYLASKYDGVEIIDITDKSNPVVVTDSHYDTRAKDIFINGNYAYIAVNGDGLIILDITDKAAPALSGSLDTGSSYGISIDGNYAYLADYSQGLVIVDITDHSNLAIVGSYDTGSGINISLNGNYAYVGDKLNGLVIVDVTDKANPVGKGSVANINQASGVQTDGIYAYVGDMYKGLSILNISDKENISFVGSVGDEGYDVIVEGNYAYITGYSDFEVVDISNKNAPALISSTSIGSSGGGDIFIDGNNAYIADRTNLTIFDITDKTAPAKKSFYQIDSKSRLSYDVVAIGNYVYVASGVHDRGDLQIFDVTDKENPIFVSKYDSGKWTGGVAVEGDYAYLTCSDGLKVLDIKDKLNPTLIGSFSGSSFEKIVLDGSYVYISKSSSGITILDIEDNTAPTLVNSYDTYQASNIFIYKNSAYVADSRNGLVILEVPTKQEIVHLPLIKTGLTKSYATDGTLITDDSIKDDGYYQAGLKRGYSRTNNVLRDNVTNLEWQDDENVTKPWITQDNANAGNDDNTSGDTATTYCLELSLDGGGWRLPSIEELETLVDYGENNSSVTTGVFQHISPSYYWSSTADVSSSSDTWSVEFSYGYSRSYDKSNEAYVRCVRGGQLNNPIFSRDDTTEIVSHSAMGLEWQDNELVKTTQATWQDAIDYCENNVSLGGHDDWRLPNIKELLSITDRSRTKPVINSTFINSTSLGYWSSTTSTLNPSYTWYVYFGTGGSGEYAKSDDTRYVRCVRGGQLDNLKPKVNASVIMYLLN